MSYLSNIIGIPLVPQSEGFTITGGVTPKTLTVPLDASVSGTNTGDNAANSSSHYIGTTSVALNRASAALTLAGITLTTPALGTPTSGNLGNCTNAQMVFNLKPVVNAAVNKLDVFTKSGGAVPDATNVISVAIPDGNGYTFRSRAAAYLSGTSQFILADAANYWSKGSLDAEIKTAYIYAIWDGTGIIWALGGYSGFTRCPASTTATDDDFFLLEASSTYTKAITEYCVCVGKIRYQYDTADTPDHTIQATVIDAPQVVWNPRSDYSGILTLTSTNTSGSNIAEYSVLSKVVKQTGKYFITAQVQCYLEVVPGISSWYIRTGSSTYASAIVLSSGQVGITIYSGVSGLSGSGITAIGFINADETVHLGAAVQAIGGSGNRAIDGGGNLTSLNFHRID